MEIRFEDGQVIISLPKAILVMSRKAFIDTLKRGKAYRRRQALARVSPVEPRAPLPPSPDLLPSPPEGVKGSSAHHARPHA